MAATPAGRQVVPDPGLHVGGRVAGEDRHARAFTRRVGHDLEPLEHEPEVDEAHDDEQQQRKDQRELDELGAPLRPEPRASSITEAI